MNSVKDWCELVNYKINEGYEYGWNCYGPNAYGLNSYEDEQYSITIIFDTKDQTVYCLEAVDYRKDLAFRIFNPDYIQAYKDKVKYSQVNDVAYENVKFIDLELVSDFYQKAKAIVENTPYDNRVNIELELEDHEVLYLYEQAHKHDITLNQMVEKILWNVIKEHNKNEVKSE